MSTATPPLSDVHGLAHVATASFLAARLSPGGAFWIALAGGLALARAAQRHGLRPGYGASLAATIETVAIMGPARLMGPLTQAMSAPMLGRMEERGMRPALQVLACGVVRLAHNALLTAFFIWVIVGGVDAYGGTHDALGGRLPLVPEGTAAALGLTAAGLLGWAVAGSAIQVGVYRRGLRAWRDATPGPAGPAAPEPTAATGRRCDPRAVAVAAALALACLLTGTAWATLAAVAAWLVLAAAYTGGDRDVLLAGLGVAALLGLSALAFGLLGGLGADKALRRAARAALLVAVATWMRAAAGPDGVREVARRVLGRLRRVPAFPEATVVVERLGSGRQLLGAGRALVADLRGVRHRPVPVLDAVLGWVRREAGGFSAPAARARPALRARARDAILVAAAALPALAIALG